MFVVLVLIGIADLVLMNFTPVALLIGLILFLIVVIFRSEDRKSRSRSSSPRLPAWYEAKGSITAIRPYANTDLASADANRAAPFGWSVQSVATNDGRINVGRAATGAALAGGIALVDGGSQSNGVLTITYKRPAA